MVKFAQLLNSLGIMRAFLLLNVFALALAGCGGSSSAPSNTNSGSGFFGGSGGSGNSAPTISMANGDQSAPIGHDFTYDASQGGQTFVDAEGNAMTYNVAFEPNNGDFSASGPNITGQATGIGDVTVTVSASDGSATSVSDSFVISSDYDQDAIMAAFGASVDLSALADYETRVTPDYIRAPNDVTNPLTNAGATLGRVLFYDTALSTDDTVACASCHQQANAFSDSAVVSSGVAGGVTGRHSMRLINTQWSDELAFFWDERAMDLEDQVTDPIRDHNEHGFSGQDGRPTFDDLIIKMEGIDYYEELFAFTFGTPDITEARMQSALAQFVNSIVSFDSRFDEGRAQVTDPFAAFPNYTFDENQGKLLYMSDPVDNGGGCRRCHADPEFSVFEDSRHIGVIGVAGNPNATDFTNTRSPSLRDVFGPGGAPNGPFMHDGSMATMAEVMNHYNAIPVPADPAIRQEFMDTIDPQLVEFGQVENLNLTQVERNQIIAFMRTLTGSNVYTDPKWSNPF